MKNRPYGKFVTELGFFAVAIEINTVPEAILVVLVATQPTMAVPAPLNI